MVREKHDLIIFFYFHDILKVTSKIYFENSEQVKIKIKSLKYIQTLIEIVVTIYNFEQNSIF